MDLYMVVDPSTPDGNIRPMSSEITVTMREFARPFQFAMNRGVPALQSKCRSPKAETAQIAFLASACSLSLNRQRWRGSIR